MLFGSLDVVVVAKWVGIREPRARKIGTLRTRKEDWVASCSFSLANLVKQRY